MVQNDQSEGCQCDPNDLAAEYEEKMQNMAGEVLEVNLSKDQSEKFGLCLNQSESGIFVRSVVPGSRSEMAGLQSGDWVWKVNGTMVAHLNPLEVVRVLTKNQNNLTLLIKRASAPEDKPAVDDNGEEEHEIGNGDP